MLVSRRQEEALKSPPDSAGDEQQTSRPSSTTPLWVTSAAPPLPPKTAESMVPPSCKHIAVSKVYPYGHSVTSFSPLKPPPAKLRLALSKVDTAPPQQSQSARSLRPRPPARTKHKKHQRGSRTARGVASKDSSTVPRLGGGTDVPQERHVYSRRQRHVSLGLLVKR